MENSEEQNKDGAGGQAIGNRKRMPLQARWRFVPKLRRGAKKRAGTITGVPLRLSAIPPNRQAPKDGSARSRRAMVFSLPMTSSKW
jgi:hypothetical protein